MWGAIDHVGGMQYSYDTIVNYYQEYRSVYTKIGYNFIYEYLLRFQQKGSLLIT